MEFGIALAISGVAFLVGALCGSIWGEGSSYLGQYATGGGLIAAGFTSCYVSIAAVTMGDFRRAISSSSMTRHRLIFVGLMAAFLGLILGSSAIGRPHSGTLPSIALGSGLLFHIERAAAVLALVGAVVLVAWRGARGDWPITFGNVGYAPKEAVQVTADALAKQQVQLGSLEDRVTKTAEVAVDELAKQERQLLALKERLGDAIGATADAITKQDKRLRLLEDGPELSMTPRKPTRSPIR